MQKHGKGKMKKERKRKPDENRGEELGVQVELGAQPPDVPR